MIRKRSAVAAPPSGCTGDHQDGVVAGDGAEDVGRPTRSIAEAKYCAAPGGVRSTTRLADASAETSTSWHSRASRASKVANSPSLGLRSPPSPGHRVDQVTAGPADPERADLDQVAGQGALGDLQPVGGQQVGQLGLGPDLAGAASSAMILACRAVLVSGARVVVVIDGVP